jgi:hypothetical protein
VPAGPGQPARLLRERDAELGQPVMRVVVVEVPPAPALVLDAPASGLESSSARHGGRARRTIATTLPAIGRHLGGARRGRDMIATTIRAEDTSIVGCLSV